MTRLSILDLVRVTEDVDARAALDNARDIAVHAEAWGYRRIWVAEHHNMPGIASAATSVVIGHIAAGTKTIRVGAGGIMLPNHAPYVIAEQFGTLARLFPGRIDLGLGRAPGTDQLTLRALRRTPEAAENFPQDVLELQAAMSYCSASRRRRQHCPPGQQRRYHREHRLCWQGSWRSDATLELDSLKCNWYGYRYDREQSYGECRPHHEFRRLRRRRGNDFGGNREKPPDKPGRGAEDPQAPRAGGTGRSFPRPSRRRRSPAPVISHNTRSDLQGG